MFSGKTQAEEIRELVALGLEDEWPQIRHALQGIRTEHGVGHSGYVRKEFDIAAKRVGEVIDKRLERFLELCQSRSVRPDLVIEPTIEALREFTKHLQRYGDERASTKGRVDQTALIVGESDKAVAAAKKHLEAARTLALQGHANGRLVLPRTAWDKRWWQKLLGFIGRVLSFAFRWLVRSGGSPT